MSYEIDLELKDFLFNLGFSGSGQVINSEDQRFLAEVLRRFEQNKAKRILNGRGKPNE